MGLELEEQQGAPALLDLNACRGAAGVRTKPGAMAPKTNFREGSINAAINMFV